MDEISKAQKTRTSLKKYFVILVDVRFNLLNPQVMKRTPFYFLFLFLATVLSAQTPRLCLYEVFNGENCPPSVPTNQYINPLLALPTNTQKVCVLNWEVPIPSAPTATWSLYQTNQAENYYRFSSAANGGYGYVSQGPNSTATVGGINSAPSGLMDGQQVWLFGAISSHPMNLNSTVIATAQSYTSAFSIAMTRAWNIGSTAVELTVSIVASANYTASGALVFRTVMMEKNINFTTPPGTNGETSFQNVAIKSFPTLTAGISMAPTWTVGQSQTFTLSCPVPSYARDKSEIDMIGFIQNDGNKVVAQAFRTGTDPVDNDAKAVSSTVNPVYCQQGQISPTVVVKNTGLNIINAFTITPFVNTVAASNYLWTGTLTPGNSVTITIPPFVSTAIVNGSNTFSYSIISVNGGDLNFANNAWSNTFIGQTSVTALFLDANNKNLCEGETFVLNAYGSGNAVLQPGALVGPSFTLNPTTSIIYTITADVGVGCTQNTTYCNVTIVPNPTVTALGGTVCAGNTFSLYPNGALSYYLLPLNTASTNFVFAPTSSGTYTIIGYDANGCIDSTSIQISLIQNALQNLAIAGPFSICKGESYVLQASGAQSYTWSNGTLGATQVFNPQSTIVISVTGEDQNTCTKEVQKTLIVVDCLGIADLNKNTQWQMFPNPARESLDIKTSGEGLLSIFDSTGKLCLQKKLNAGENSIQINDLSAGFYLIEFNGQRQKLVVMQ